MLIFNNPAPDIEAVLKEKSINRQELKGLNPKSQRIQILQFTFACFATTLRSLR